MELEYNSSFHVRHQLTLKSGRQIYLRHLEQGLTYGDVLEGYPNGSINDHYLKHRPERFKSRGRTHLITPVRRPYFVVPGDQDPSIKRQPDRIPEFLPSVECAAWFSSAKIDQKSKQFDQSELIVLWYQDEFAMPILEPALQQILSLDWDQRAQDVEIG